MSFDIKLEKLKYDLFMIYGSNCLVNKTNYDNVVHSIVPSDILCSFNGDLVYSIFNNIILSRYLSNLMNNFTISIFPNPITTFIIPYKNKNYTFGIFRGIYISNMRYEEFQIQLLVNSCYFLKWHFLKFLECNTLHPIYYRIVYELNSDQYIYDTLMNIKQVGIDYVNDKDGYPVVYEQLRTYY